MLVDRALVERLERVETATVGGLVEALVATGCTDPVPSATTLGRGLLVVTGPRRYVNRAVGVTLDDLGADDVDAVVRHYADAGLPAAVQLSSWASEVTAVALRRAGFAPDACRSVLAVDLRQAPPARAAAGAAAEVEVEVEVVTVDDDPACADLAADVMAADVLGQGGDRAASDEFMAADRVAPGTTQLLALVDGRPVGCGSLTVVRTGDDTTGWLGAAATVPAARRRGVQTTLVRHRLRLAAEVGCDLVGATASVGSTSARVLQRCGFALVQEQWVVRR